jgi:hypothetical protein
VSNVCLGSTTHDTYPCCTCSGAAEGSPTASGHTSCPGPPNIYISIHTYKHGRTHSRTHAPTHTYPPKHAHTHKHTTHARTRAHAQCVLAYAAMCLCVCTSTVPLGRSLDPRHQGLNTHKTKTTTLQQTRPWSSRDPSHQKARAPGPGPDTNSQTSVT